MMYPCLVNAAFITRRSCGSSSHDVLRKTQFQFAAAADITVDHHKPASPVPSHLVAYHQNRMGPRDRHGQMLELRLVQPPSFVVQGGDTVFLFLTRAVHVEGVRITPHELSRLLIWSNFSGCDGPLRRGHSYNPRNCSRSTGG